MLQKTQSKKKMTRRFPPHRNLFTALCAASLTLYAATNEAAPRGLVVDQTRELAFSAVGGSVIVIDVADPTNPVLVADTIQTQGVVQNVEYDATTQMLYVAAGEGDLEIWDIQNPASPQQVSVTAFYYFGVETPVNSVAVSGVTAHVSTGWGYLHSADISDPSNPVTLGFNASSGNPSREVYAGDDGTLHLAGPQTVSWSLNPDGTLLSADSNRYSRSSQVHADGDYLYTSSNNSLSVLDATQAGFPFAGQYDFGRGIGDIFVVGNYAYLTNGLTGLHILDVSNKDAILEVGRDGSAGAHGVVVVGRYAYVRRGTSLQIVDVNVPSSPTVVSTFDAVGTVGNIAPVANAGRKQSVRKGSAVTLDGSRSYDLDGSVVSYSWTQVSGPSVRLTNTTSAVINFKAPRRLRSVADLVFELTVTDDGGASATGQATVRVYL